jgi:hypothetical protein
MSDVQEFTMSLEDLKKRLEGEQLFFMIMNEVEQKTLILARSEQDAFEKMSTLLKSAGIFAYRKTDLEVNRYVAMDQNSADVVFITTAVSEEKLAELFHKLESNKNVVNFYLDGEIYQLI